MAWQPVVVDPRLVAVRGEAASAGAMQVDADSGLRAGELLEGAGDDGHGLGWYPQGEETRVASASVALDASNKGFQLLAKMGWAAGRGLGKNEDGILEPVAAGVDAGLRLGLGKQAQDDHFTNPELIQRRMMESEIQANEDEERRARREAQVEREERIKADVSAALRKFYCDICFKQYANAMEMEQHLSSYDHHHKKRLKEAQALMSERTRDERARKEAKRAEKEAARLQQQIARAQQQQQELQQRRGSGAAAGPGPGSGGVDPAPPPPPGAVGAVAYSTAAELAAAPLPSEAEVPPPLPPDDPGAPPPPPPPAPAAPPPFAAASEPGPPPSPPGEPAAAGPAAAVAPPEQRGSISFGMKLGGPVGSGRGLAGGGAAAGRGRGGVALGRGGGLAGGRGISIALGGGAAAGASGAAAAAGAARPAAAKPAAGRPALFGGESSSEDEEAAEVAKAAAGRRHAARPR